MSLPGTRRIEAAWRAPLSLTFEESHYSVRTDVVQIGDKPVLLETVGLCCTVFKCHSDVIGSQTPVVSCRMIFLQPTRKDGVCRSMFSTQSVGAPNSTCHTSIEQDGLDTVTHHFHHRSVSELQSVEPASCSVTADCLCTAMRAFPSPPVTFLLRGNWIDLVGQSVGEEQATFVLIFGHRKEVTQL